MQSELTERPLIHWDRSVVDLQGTTDPSSITTFIAHSPRTEPRLSSYATRGCVILLGPSGVGKTTALQLDRLTRGSMTAMVDLAAFNPADIAQHALAREDIRQLLAAEGERWLYLDTLDDSVAVASSTALAMEGALKAANLKGLHVWLACRHSAWLRGLRPVLLRAFPADLAILELSSLRPQEIARAAQEWGFEPSAFLGAVEDAGVFELAEHPLTLTQLLVRFSTGATLSGSQEELYREAILRLVSYRRSATVPVTGDAVDTWSFQAIARRIAAVSVLCNSPTLSLGPEPRGDVATVSDLCRGVELVGDESVRVDATSVAAVCASGLFEPASEAVEDVRFRFQSYAELLAAEWCDAHDLNWERVKPIVIDRRTGCVYPHLRGFAAWMAALREDARTYLIEQDVDALLGGSVIDAIRHDPQAVLTSLARGLEGRRVDPSRFHRASVRGLAGCPGLSTFLTSALGDDGRVDPLLDRAALVIGEVAAPALTAKLAAGVAANSRRGLGSRTLALRVVREWGGPEDRLRVKPLISEPGLPGDARAAAIWSLWPDLISTTEMFEAVDRIDFSQGPGLAALYMGRIGRVLREDDLADALAWVARVARKSEFAIRATVADILARGQQALDRDDVRAALLPALVAWFDGHGPLLQRRTWPTRKAGAGHRRELTADLMASGPHRAHDVAGMGLLDGDDLAWVEDQAQHGAAERRAEWRRLAQLSVPTGEEATGTGVESESTRPSGRYGSALVWMGPKAAAKPRSHNPRVKLADVRAGVLAARADVSKWLRVVQLLTRSRGYDIPGLGLMDGSAFAALDDMERRHLVDGAVSFLNSGPFEHDGWIESGQWPYVAVAILPTVEIVVAAAAGGLLRRETWAGLAPTLLVSIAGEPGDSTTLAALLREASRAAPIEFAAAAARVVRAETRRYLSLPVLYRFDDVWFDLMGTELVGTISDVAAVAPKGLAELLVLLLSHHVDGARDAAARLIAQRLAGGDARLAAVAAAASLIRAEGDAGWPLLQELLDADGEYVQEALSSAAREAGGAGLDLAARLSLDDAAELLLWLIPRLPEIRGSERQRVMTAPQPLHELAQGVAAGIARLSTDAACDALVAVASRTPDAAWLKGFIAAAEDNRLAAAWPRVTPTELRTLAAAASRRYVVTSDDLLSAVIDAIEGLSQALHGRSGLARLLWNETRSGKATPTRWPKSEAALSDLASYHLGRELTRRRLIVNREVQIRPSDRGDLLIETVDGRGGQHLGAVVEVKGCWNRGVRHDIATQLVARYLTGTGFNHGLYLVGCFCCDVWDPTDWRKRRHDRGALSAELATTAATLSDERRVVRSMVLDCGWR
jgi:hypothetical protein